MCIYLNGIEISYIQDPADPSSEAYPDMGKRVILR